QARGRRDNNRDPRSRRKGGILRDVRAEEHRWRWARLSRMVRRLGKNLSLLRPQILARWLRNQPLGHGAESRACQHDNASSGDDPPRHDVWQEDDVLWL